MPKTTRIQVSCQNSFQFSALNRTSSPCSRCLSPEFSTQGGRRTCGWSHLYASTPNAEGESVCGGACRPGISPPGGPKRKAASSHGVIHWASYLLELGWRKLLGAVSFLLYPLGPDSTTPHCPRNRVSAQTPGLPTSLRLWEQGPQERDPYLPREGGPWATGWGGTGGTQHCRLNFNVCLLQTSPR